MVERIRTFISITVPLTDTVRSALNMLHMTKGVKSTDPGQVHMTVRFLGDVDADKMPAICNAVAKSLEGTKSFSLCMKGMGTFPKGKSPRVVWVGFEDDKALNDVAKKVTAALDELGVSYDDKFTPHVTLGRVVNKGNVAPIVDRYKDETFANFTCTHVDVMKSVLTRDGGRHFVIRTIPLVSD